MSEFKKFLIVFDMNGVLMSRNERLNQFFSEKPIAIESYTIHSVFPNIDLDVLSKFYLSHSFYIGLWTTCMKKNGTPVLLILEDILQFKFDFFMTQEDCSIGEMTGNIKTKRCIKDLRKPSRMLGVEVKNSLLVDDSIGKRCEDQNVFIFNSEERDIIRAIKEIDKFICCTDMNCIAKTLN